MLVLLLFLKYLYQCIGTWRESAEMNEGRNYAGTCMDNNDGKIYVIGGCLTKKTSTAEVYDINTSKWTSISNTNTKRDSSGVIHISQLGKIFSIGGYNNRSKQYLTTVEKYNPGNNISYNYQYWYIIKSSIL